MYVTSDVAISRRGVALPAGSVGTKQIRKGAVTLAKISGSARQALRGQRGATGLQGPKGIQGAQGPKGDTGAAGLSALSTLPTGQTETGTFAAGGPSYVTPGSGTFVSGVTFPVPLANALPASHVVYVASASAPNCPGAGQAASGYLCLYPTAVNSISSPQIIDPTSATAAPGASRSGFMFTVNSVGGQNPAVYDWGTWAVTG